MFCVPLGLHREQLGIARHDLLDAAVLWRVFVEPVLAEVVGGEGQSTTGVLLLGEPEEVGRVGDLRLDLLLAVPEVVVGDHRDDDAVLVPGTDLEGLAVVVEVVLVFPAHAIATLAFGGVVHVGQAQ